MKFALAANPVGGAGRHVEIERLGTIGVGAPIARGIGEGDTGQRRGGGLRLGGADRNDGQDGPCQRRGKPKTPP